MASVGRAVLKERLRPLTMKFMASRSRGMVAVIVTVTKERERRGRETVWQSLWGE